MATHVSPNKSPNSFIAQFSVPRLAFYASAPNHVFGQYLGCPAPVFATIRSVCSAMVVKGELLRLCFWFVQSSTSVEKVENWLSWCGESWSTTQRPIRIFCNSFRTTRRTFLYFSGHLCNATVFGLPRTYQGLHRRPTIKLLRLSESVKAL